MSKKGFITGLDHLLEGSNSEKEEAKLDKQTKDNEEKEIRATFIITEGRINIVKALAYWQRKQIKQVLQESLDLYFSQVSKNEMDNAITAFNSKTKI